MIHTDHRRPTHHRRTASRVFSGEAVVISPAENMVRMFNPIGSRIWELSDGSRTIDDIALLLSQEFDVTLEHAHQSTADFIDELAAKGLISFEESA
jgi:hypothetical protein